MSKLDELKLLCEEIKQCNRCDLASTSRHHLCGEGNPDSRIMLIAQAPGGTEDAVGRMFVGPSGKVLDELLAAARVERDEIYMTNLVKCRLPKNRRPTEDEIKACSRFLRREIEIVKPEVLVPLGYVASKFILKEYGVNIPENFREVYGKLLWTGELKIYPLRHPAALLYDQSLEETMKKNYGKLFALKRECMWRPVCPMTRYYKEGKLDRKWIELYCKGDWLSCKRYQLEAEGIPHPDNMLPDGTIREDLEE